MSASSLSLRDHLVDALSTLPNADKLHIVSLTSAPKRTSSLFPHTTVPPRCFQVDYFVVLGCEIDVPLSPVTDEARGSAEDEQANLNGDDIKVDPTTSSPLPTATPSVRPPPTATPERQLVLTSAISAHLYILPHSQTSILYISKVDSSSYPSTSSTSSRPLPLTRTLITSFISYFLLPISRPTPNVRVQLFARSQGQYLFPNSEKGKKGLGGAKLCGWWKGVYEDVTRTLLHRPNNDIDPSQLHLAFVLPSFSELEAQGMLGAPRQPLPSGVHWKYEPPFSTPIPNIGKKAQEAHTGPKAWRYLPGYSLADLIPSLEDDPKTRFLDEVATATGKEYELDEKQLEKAAKKNGTPSRKGNGNGKGKPHVPGRSWIAEPGDCDGEEEDLKDVEANHHMARALGSGGGSAADNFPHPKLDPIPATAEITSPTSQPPSSKKKPVASQVASTSQPKSRDQRTATAQEDEVYRKYAHHQLKRITPSEFWERIGFRGECASDVTGFFTLTIGSSSTEQTAASPSTSSSNPTTSILAPKSTSPHNPSHSPDPVISRGNLPHAIVERIQTALMNTDFSTIEWALQGTGDWLSSTRQIVAGEIGTEGLEKYCEGIVLPKSAEELRGEAEKGGGKREREQEAVTVLQPRKKKKV